MKKVIGIFFSVLILVWLATMVVPVYPAQFVVITRLGRPVRVIDRPGPAIKAPWPFESATHIGGRLNLTEVTPLEVLTQDKKNLVMGAFAVWRVMDPLKFLSSVRTFDAASVRIGDMVASLLGNQVASMPLNDFISVDHPTALKKVDQALLRQVKNRCKSAFGIDVVDVRVERMIFPDDNLRHVFNRMRAERRRIAKKYRAEGEEKAMKIMSDTDLKVRKILADAKMKALQIEGDAQAKVLALKRKAWESNPEFYRFYRRLQAVKTVLKRGGQLIISTNSWLFSILEGIKAK